MSLFSELQRRKVLKVGGAYLVLAWLAVRAACSQIPGRSTRQKAPARRRVRGLLARQGLAGAVPSDWRYRLRVQARQRERPQDMNFLTELRRRNVIRMAGCVAALNKLGVPAYWRKHGYPPQCRAKGSSDFICDEIRP
jgi:hypothetical protein